MADDKRPGWGAFLPRFNIPETFGAALSYEGQLHWFLENWDEVAEYANSLEQPTVTVGKTEFPDTSNALTPSITNSGTDINAVLDFTYPVIRTRFADPLEWDFDKAYDVLTVVSDGQGNSYTSRQEVPAHTPITDTDYWVLTGVYDASLQAIRDDLVDVKGGYSRVYGTVADMQSDTEILSGMICRTLGFHAVGDGGASWYVIGSGTANGMDVLQLATNDCATAVIKDNVTPEQFGAVGDGVSDDTARLQKCISSNRNVRLTGNYYITSTIDMSNLKNVTIEGGVISRPQNALFTTLRGDYCEDVTISGVKFRGNGNSRDDEYAWPDSIQGAIILASQSRRIRVESCLFDGFNYGVFILGADLAQTPDTSLNMAFDGSIANCTFHNCNSAIDTYGKGTKIVGNVFLDITEHAIQIEPNYIGGTSENPTEDQYWYTAAVGSVIAGNLIIGDDKTAIIVHNSNAYATYVVNNTIIDYARGIFANNSAGQSMIISGNMLIYQRPQALTADTRPWGLSAAITCGDGAVVSDNVIDSADVGISDEGGSIVCANLIDMPRVSGIVYYALSTNLDKKSNYSGNQVLRHTLPVSGWYGSRAIVVARGNRLFMSNCTVDSDTQPVFVNTNTSGVASGMLSNVTQTQALPRPSDLYVYDN